MLAARKKEMEELRIGLGKIPQLQAQVESSTLAR
jgi:hypothetical protein